MNLPRLSFTAATLALAVAPVVGSAQSAPPGLRDMVGARAGQAEGELGRRGYRNVGGQKGDDRSYTFWWNEAQRRCVTIATMNGRYVSIVESPAPDCRKGVSGVGDPPAAGWPATLRPIGRGYPDAASPCRRVGETAATNAFLDDSRTLVGCPLPRRNRQVVALLRQGGRIVAQERNVLLISIPRRR